jgi:multidrug transporter EmrE-like cation transporter
VRTVATFVVLILAGVAGDLGIARAMKQGGRIDDLRPHSVLRGLVDAFRRRSMWIGVALQAIAFVSFLSLLSSHDVAVVVPATALSYVVGTAGAKLFLHERVEGARWAGVALITGGVALLLTG